MTKEKIVEKLYSALRVMDVNVESVLKTAKDADGRSSSLAVFSEYPEFHIADLIVALESDILNENAKKNGTAKKLKAGKKILEMEYKKKKALKIKPIFFQIQGKIFDAERLMNLMNCVEPDKIGVSKRALGNAGMLRVEDNNGNIGFLCGFRNNNIPNDSIIKIES